MAPLLRGRVEVESVTLVEPVIWLETLAGGRANWEFSPPVTQKPAARARATPARRDPARSAPADADVIRLDSLRIVNGTLVYRDAGSDTVERIEQLNAEVSAGSLAGPFRAKGTLVARRVPIEFDTNLGRITEGAATPITLRVKFTNANARLDMTGTVAEIATAPRMSGRLKLSGDDFARFAAAFGDGKRSVSALPPWMRQKFALDARVKASAKEATAAELLAELGDVRATGGVTATFGGRVGAKIRLKINRVDIDRWLTMKAKPTAARAKAAGSGKADGPAPAPARGHAQAPERGRGDAEPAPRPIARRGRGIVVRFPHRARRQAALRWLAGGTRGQFARRARMAENRRVVDPRRPAAQVHAVRQGAG